MNVYIKWADKYLQVEVSGDTMRGESPVAVAIEYKKVMKELKEREVDEVCSVQIS